MSYSEQEQLIKGFVVTIGVVVFGLNGPWIFQRFGPNVPEGAALGCLAGAAVSYFCAGVALSLRNRKHAGAGVREVTKSLGSAGIENPRTEGLGTDMASLVIRCRIQEELARLTEPDAKDIHVEVRNSKVFLQGMVHSWEEETEAERIAFDMPGIQEVENRLEVRVSAHAA